MGQTLTRLGIDISKLFNWVTGVKQKAARILFIGLDAAGKTTILYQMKLGEVVTTIPTIGFNVETVDVGKVCFTCWDVGGEDKIRALWRHYYANTNALIFVIDSGDLDRMDEAFELLNRTYSDDEISGIPVLIFMNKSDRENRMNSIEFIERYRLYEYFREPNWFIFDTCGLSGQGLMEGFTMISDVLQGKDCSQPYHCKGYSSVTKIYRLGWSPETHMLFPKNFRRIVWGLILLNDRIGISIDSIRIVLSFIEIRPSNFEEMKRISEHFLKNEMNFKSIPRVHKVLTIKN